MGSIRHILHINRNVEDVKSAILEKDHLISWYTNDIIIKDTDSNKMEFKFGDISATALIKMDGNIIEWKYIDSTFEILIGNSLTFTLEEKEDKTRVLAEQNGFDLESDMSANFNFSLSKYLESLRQYL
jgi:hypothetical protein